MGYPASLTPDQEGLRRDSDILAPIMGRPGIHATEHWGRGSIEASPPNRELLKQEQSHVQLRKGMGGWGKENIKRDAPIRYRIILSGIRSVIYILKYQKPILDKSAYRNWYPRITYLTNRTLKISCWNFNPVPASAIYLRDEYNSLSIYEWPLTMRQIFLSMIEMKSKLFYFLSSSNLKVQY